MANWPRFVGTGALNGTDHPFLLTPDDHPAGSGPAHMAPLASQRLAPLPTLAPTAIETTCTTPDPLANPAQLVGAGVAIKAFAKTKKCAATLAPTWSYKAKDATVVEPGLAQLGGWPAWPSDPSAGLLK
jgi:hypothetical protein